MIRTAVLSAMTMVMAGCDSGRSGKREDAASLDGKKQAQSSDIARLQNELRFFEENARTEDMLLSNDIRSIRMQIENKVYKGEALRIVQEEMDKKHIKDRLLKLNQDLDEIDARIKKLQEPFGILPRIPEAPWYKEKESK